MQLPADEVHLWRASLDWPTEALEALSATLSESERARAARFYFERDRNHFIAARGILRGVLGRYLCQRPSEIRLALGEWGKPYLPRSPLRFNLSHSGGLALYAVAFNRELGVDVECIRPGTATEGIAERFFSRGEVAVFQSLPAREREAAFFRCWTRKEAYIKARGQGLSLGLANFDVSLRPGDPAALLASKDGAAEVARWRMESLDPGPGYFGAVIAEGSDWHLRTFTWPQSD